MSSKYKKIIIGLFVLFLITIFAEVWLSRYKNIIPAEIENTIVKNKISGSVPYIRGVIVSNEKKLVGGDTFYCDYNIDNYAECVVLSLYVLTDDNLKKEIVFYRNTLCANESASEDGNAKKEGEMIEVYGKIIAENVISTCDSDEYYIKPIRESKEEESFIDVGISPEWTTNKKQISQLDFITPSGRKNYKNDLIYRVRDSDGPLFIAGSVSSDIEKISATWIPISTENFVSPESDWITSDVWSFRPGGNSWTYEASIDRENLSIFDEPQKYIFTGSTHDGKEVTDSIIVHRVSASKDIEALTRKIIRENQEIIRNYQASIAESEKFAVLERYEINENLTVYLLKNRCENKSFKESLRCSGADSQYLVLYDKRKNKNFGLNHYILSNDEKEFKFSYDEPTKQLYIDVKVFKPHSNTEWEKLDIIDLANTVDNL